MSSTQKGDAFELRVYNILKNLLSTGQLPLPADCCTIYQKKAYFSYKRKDNIIVDIAIEVMRPGASKPSMYWIIECKDYGSKVPVNDVEEFHSKIQQITGANVKGFLFVTSALQQGAYDYADNCGIGVARVKTDSDIQWFLELKKPNFITSSVNADYTRAMTALSHDLYISEGEELLGFYRSRPVKSFHQLLNAWIKDSLSI